MTLFPRHHDREHFECAPDQQEAKSEKPCFEDSRAGTVIFWLVMIVVAAAVLYRFHAVMLTGHAP